MANMFCVECGKDGPIFREGSCISCYIKTHSFSKGPEIIDIPMCSHCSAYKYKNLWTSDLLNEVLRKTIKNTFNISKELKKIDINSECKEEKNGMDCKVFITGFFDDVKLTEEHNLFVRLKKTVCDVCSKRFGGYHEAIFQIRTDKRKLSKDELENIRLSVETLVENMQAKGNRGLFITDVGEEHGGLDFYISDKGSGLVIAKKIQDQFGGTIKQSSKNIGMKDSKQVYRMTYLLRLPAFKKEDFISYNNSFFYISSISGSKVHVIELLNWTKQIFDLKDIQKANIHGNKELVKDMILVSQSESEVQIMNPKTYETFDIRKPKNISFESKTVQIVKIKDRIFLFMKNIINK